MEVVVTPGRLPDAETWQGRSVMVTGHTGFKGGWLCHWLHLLGAEVHGLALDPSTTPSLFVSSDVGSKLSSDVRGNVQDATLVADAIHAAKPEVVFHMAAQPLVREGYRDPLSTWRTNVMGTAHLLEGVRSSASVRAVVVATTDKVYRNREWVHPYREVDELGGTDPYSASKSAAELVCSSYRQSFFGPSESGGPTLVTARAGNVIGGGDWSPERLMPDLLAALGARSAVHLRNPTATRPWQHVLDPLLGYLLLAERMLSADGWALPSAWNFGPDASSIVPVINIVHALASASGCDIPVLVDSAGEPHEAQLLALDSSQAHALLDWSPRWGIQEAIERTLAWHRAWSEGADMATFTQSQVAAYSEGS